MAWRIVESRRGFHAQRYETFSHENDPMEGYTSEHIIVYESARFDTRRQAEKYIGRRGMTGHAK